MTIASRASVGPRAFASHGYPQQQAAVVTAPMSNTAPTPLSFSMPNNSNWAWCEVPPPSSGSDFAHPPAAAAAAEVFEEVRNCLSIGNEPQAQPLHRGGTNIGTSLGSA